MRKIRKKFKKPRISWDSALIKEEKKIMKDYGLRRKREILSAREILRKFRRRARELIAVENKEQESILLDKLEKLGLLTKGKELDDVLALKVEDILNRRLQTLVFKSGLAKSPKEARQFITHGHIQVTGRVMPFPAYLVPATEEKSINFYSKPKRGK